VILAGRITLGGEAVEGSVSCARIGTDPLRRNVTGSLDGGGQYRITLPDPGRYLLQARLHPGKLPWNGFQWSTEIDVPAQREHRHDQDMPVGRIRGQVHTREGEPVSNQRVCVVRPGEGSFSWQDPDTYTVADGRYELLVAPGTWSVAAGGPSTFGGRSRLGTGVASDLVLVAGQVREDVDLELPDGAAISGRVLVPADQLARGIEVCAFDGIDWVREETDAAGRFHLSGLAAGTLRVEARGERFSLARPLEVPVSEGETRRLELELVRGVPVSVRIEGGAEVAALALLDAQGSQLGPLRGAYPMHVTDLGALPAGRYVLRARQGTRVGERAFEVRGNETEFALTLELE
jgi:hypothetical protein